MGSCPGGRPGRRQHDAAVLLPLGGERTAAAAAALPVALLAEKGGKAIIEVAQTPVIGWTKVEERVKRGRIVTTKHSLEVRAWEIVLGAGLLWLFAGAPLGNGKSFFSFDPFNILPPSVDELLNNPLAFDPFHILTGLPKRSTTA